VTSLPSRRSVIRASVWAVPAVSIVAAAPAFASSVAPALSARSDGFEQDPESGGTYFFGIFVTNTGSGPIPAGGLVAFLPDSRSYSYSGYSAGQWEDGYDPLSGATTFTYISELAAGEETEGLSLLLNRTRSPAPTAVLSVVAAGYTDTTVPLEILY